MSVEFLIVAAVTGAALFWYYRAYREARAWKEVHAAWGVEQQHRAVAIYKELTSQGIRAQLKTSGSLQSVLHPFTRPHAAIRVHREDFAPAARIVRSLAQG